MARIDFIQALHGKTKRNYVERVVAHDKAACATVNNRLGRLDDDRTRLIVEACHEIADGLPNFGGLAKNFPIDTFQTGSGTSSNTSRGILKLSQKRTNLAAFTDECMSSTPARTAG